MIDIHTHIAPSKGVGGEILIAYMDRLGVEKSVVLPIENMDRRSHPSVGCGFVTTDQAIRTCNENPERLVPFCCIDPREADMGQEVRRYVKAGCRGFGEHKVKLRVDDERSKDIYRVCGRLEIPVLIHMDNNYNPDLEGFEEVVSEFSNTVFIAHGPGWWGAISAKVEPAVVYPTGRVEPGGKVDRMLQEYPNLYGDLSAGSGYNAISRDIEYGRGFLKKNGRKLLFGTDYYGPPSSRRNDPKRHISLLRNLGLDEETYNAITHKNAARILKLTDQL